MSLREMHELSLQAQAEEIRLLKRQLKRARQELMLASDRLTRIEKLFPGGVHLGEMFEAKKAREEAEDRAAGIVEVPNQNPLPVDPFFHVG